MVNKSKVVTQILFTIFCFDKCFQTFTIILCFLAQKGSVCVFVAESGTTLCDPMDCSPPASVHGILQARILELLVIHIHREGDTLTNGDFPCKCILHKCNFSICRAFTKSKPSMCLLFLKNNKPKIIHVKKTYLGMANSTPLQHIYT